MHHPIRRLAIMLVMATALGCASGPKVQPANKVPQPGSSDSSSQAPAASTETTNAPAEEAGANSGFATATNPETGSHDGPAPEGHPVPELVTIYFDFDSDELSEASRNVISTNTEFLKRNGNLRVVLRGHTDARGTPEYNLSLGQRRAQAVRDALIALEVPSERLETVSFGETTPAQQGEDESAYAKNRRVEFFVY